MPHAARQLPSWLIFDVRHSPMRYVLLLVLFLSWSGCSQTPWRRFGQGYSETERTLRLLAYTAFLEEPKRHASEGWSFFLHESGEFAADLERIAKISKILPASGGQRKEWEMHISVQIENLTESSALARLFFSSGPNSEICYRVVFQKSGDRWQVSDWKIESAV